VAVQEDEVGSDEGVTIRSPPVWMVDAEVLGKGRLAPLDGPRACVAAEEEPVEDGCFRAVGGGVREPIDHVKEHFIVDHLLALGHALVLLHRLEDHGDVVDSGVEGVGEPALEFVAKTSHHLLDLANVSLNRGLFDEDPLEGLSANQRDGVARQNKVSCLERGVRHAWVANAAVGREPR